MLFYRNTMNLLELNYLPLLTHITTFKGFKLQSSGCKQSLFKCQFVLQKSAIINNRDFGISK